MRKNVFHTLQVRYFLQFEPHWLSISAWSMPHCNLSYTSIFSTRLQIYNFLLYLVIFCRFFHHLCANNCKTDKRHPWRRAEWSMEPKAQPWAMQPTGGKWNPSRLKILGFYLQGGGVIYYLCTQIAQGTSQYFSKTYHPFFLCYLKNMKNTARKTSINNMTSTNNMTSQWHTSTAWKEPVCYPDICIVSALWQTFDILTNPQGDCVSWWNTVPFLVFNHVLHHFLP